MVKRIEGLFKVDKEERPDWRERYQKTERPGWIKRKTRKHNGAVTDTRTAS